MCSRFERKTPPEKLIVRFGLLTTIPLDFPIPSTQGEIRPTDPAIIIPNANETAVLSWGLPASWDNKPLINARAETLSERKTFQPLLGNRCLVPATGYIEWRKAARNRFKNRIAPETTSDDEPFAFAGLYTKTAFTIITCSPASDIANIHSRMPVILSREAEKLWLDQSASFDAVANLLTPYTESKLIAEEDIPPGTQEDLFS
jgi:putative SOS response-associated peptidase YedK